jgi:hypothetical protein
MPYKIWWCNIDANTTSSQGKIKKFFMGFGMDQLTEMVCDFTQRFSLSGQTVKNISGCHSASFPGNCLFFDAVKGGVGPDKLSGRSFPGFLHPL